MIPTCKLRKTLEPFHVAYHTPHTVLINEVMYAVCCWCGYAERSTLHNPYGHTGVCGNYFKGKTMAKIIQMSLGENVEFQHSVLVAAAKDAINAVAHDKNVTIEHALASLVALREITNSAMDELEAAIQ